MNAPGGFYIPRADTPESIVTVVRHLSMAREDLVQIVIPGLRERVPK